MARTGRVTASTVAKFIAPDDSAIGGDLKTFAERYQSYVRTSDHTHLELKRENKPAFYWIRPYLSDEKAKIRDYFASLEVKDESAEVEGKALSQDALEAAVRKGDPDTERFDILRREVVYECLMGCDDHPATEDSVNENGKLVTHRVMWKPNTPEPIVYTYENDKGEQISVGARDAMVKDQMLVAVLFQYLFTVSNLTETEKN